MLLCLRPRSNANARRTRTGRTIAKLTRIFGFSLVDKSEGEAEDVTAEVRAYRHDVIELVDGRQVEDRRKSQRV